jgi:hypothetical protein
MYIPAQHGLCTLMGFGSRLVLDGYFRRHGLVLVASSH